jgi:hypothetical protein
MLLLTTTTGDRYTLADDGSVVARSNGPKGWDYSGKWVIVGFKRRHNAHATISLADALAGADTGQGWVVDLDHGHLRVWGGPANGRLRSLETV